MLATSMLTPAVWSQTSSQSAAPPVAVTPIPAQIETTKGENDRITELAALESENKGDYVLDSGDLLGIEVFDVPELTRDVRVSETGFISLPLLPVRVHATGLTAFQLQDKLAELLTANGLVSHPQVTVSVKEQHGQPITIVGAVRSPMTIQAVRPVTLLELLSRAGGIAEDAGGSILVTRATASPAPSQAANADAAAGTGNTPQASDPPQNPTEQTAQAAPADAQDAADSEAEAGLLNDSLTVRISLHDLLDTGDPKYNLSLSGGDVVSVPRAGVVYAVGAVSHPGGFVMASDHQDMTVLKVLSLSGGLTSTAKKKNAVIIRQSADPDHQQVPVNLEKILAFKTKDFPLQQGDILFVPNSGSRQAMSRVATTALGLASGVALVRLGNM
jgi:polysaccharide biosynthesis/export protein